MVSRLRYISRVWFYFRMGYTTYLTFMLGAVNTLILVYYFLINNVPALQSLFGHFWSFAVFGVLLGVPMAVFIGWIHMKRTPAWSSEIDIQVEANPYYYKLPPGYWQEVFAPTLLELLRQLRRIQEKQKLLTDDDTRRISQIEEKIELLMRGGFVGLPKRRLNF